MQNATIREAEMEKIIKFFLQFSDDITYHIKDWEGGWDGPRMRELSKTLQMCRTIGIKED